MGDNLTLETVAKLAGVSRSTVSRVINQQESVRPEVRERVLRVIEETGYQPNLAARSLASSRSHLIGLVIPRIVRSLFSDPYYPRLIEGISEVCNARDYVLSLFLFHTPNEEEKLYPRVLQHGLVDGVLISSPSIDDALLTRIADSRMPGLVIGRPDDTLKLSYVDVDNLAGALTAVTHLITLNYQRIGTLTLPQTLRAGVDRLAGYRQALSLRDRPLDESLIVGSDFSEAGGYRAMQRLLRAQPDAVFAASDAIALGAMRAVRDAGLRIPEDIAFVGFDDLPLAPTAVPPLTTIRQPIRRMGQLAAETLLDILQNGPEPVRRIILPTQLIIRESCGASRF